MTMVRGIQECPHCYCKVLPNSDGQCPACGKNTRDRAGVDPTRSRVRIRQDEPLPAVCMCCGKETESTRRVTCADEGDPTDVVARGCLAAALGPLLTVLMTRKRLSRRIVVFVPECRSCMAQGGAELVHVDLDNFELTFIADRGFAAALRELRSQ